MVHGKSSNFAVRSELGRLNLHFDVIKNMLLYWHRLENLDGEFPLLSEAFNCSKTLHQNGFTSWYSCVNFLLNHIDIKISDFLGMSTPQFKTNLKRILLNFYKLTWEKDRNLHKDGKLSTFTSIKNKFCFEPYLDILTNNQHRSVLTKLRISAHRLKIEIGRYQKIPREERICSLCHHNEIQDEIHFLLVCPHLNVQRLELINIRKIKCKNTQSLSYDNQFYWLMTNEDPDILRSLAGFLSNLP